MVATTPVGIALVDPKLEFIEVNDAFAALSGRRPEEYRGRPLLEVLPEIGMPLQRACREVMATRQAVKNLGLSSTKPDGRVSFWLANVTPLANDDGAIEGVNVTLVEMSGPHTPDEALRRSEVRYRRLVYATAQVIWTTDAEGNVVEPIPGWQALTGQSFEDVRGFGWLNAVHPEDRATTLASWHAAVQSRETFECERRIRRKDGEWRHMFARAVPILDEGGRIREWVGADSDITDRKLTELALHQQEEDLRLITEAVPVRIAYVDREERYRFVNAAYEPHMGAIEDIVGRTVSEVMGAAGYARLEPHIRAALAGKTVHFDTTIGDGPAMRHLSVSYVPRFSHEGDVLGFHAISNDVTEQRRLQEQLHHSQKLEAVGRLAGGVAHDFNNLLTVILSYASILEERSFANEASLRDVREIRRAGELATGLTRRLLAFARRDVVNARVLEVNAVVANVEGLLRRVLGEDVKLTVALGPSLPKVCVDSGQLEQVLVNLAVNARDAMPNGGNLTVDTAYISLSAAEAAHVPDATPGPHVVLRVTDNGIGMTPEIQARIFEPFFTTKAAGEGTGLGLSTCYGIVRHAGGHMRVSSLPAHGARFEVWLPAVEADANPSTIPPRSSVARGNEVVLVVEDEPRIRRLVVRAVREQGYTVLEAGNGVEALRLVETNNGTVDVVVTDVVMPEMGGRELAERIQALWPKIDIIYTSGYAEGTFFEDVASRSDVHFLAKPYLVDTLLDLVRRVLDTRRESERISATGS
ncbi:sensory box histidine kinase/response regulator [Labilithrix luteola]|uniref:histidine kinase n=2 Tax=Labilithrix luteola TaxID=1391654 RepID=A0A0K1PVK8_9BACT|nr:sensory box histidine kinase/response regulator [Labilithrix luteola]